MMRFDQDLLDEIEAYRAREGIKTSSEATRRLIKFGLGVCRIDTPKISAAPSYVAFVPDGDPSATGYVEGVVTFPEEVTPTFKVAVYDPKARRATPKTPKGKR